ncbi:MAG: PQQ-binding-like beta-propeller repeat protein [Gemmatimonadetes bacterium]|nr:PQQ-binding-like beta-propeller repeat protein [Gemmatimonadota bacterium]
MRGIVVMSVVCAALGVEAQAGAVPFTEAQAAGGRTLYARECAACHGRDLTGGSAAALKGREFLAKWSTGGRTLRDLFHLTRTTMPSGATHALTDDEYLAVTAHLLEENGFAAGARPLVADSAVLASVSLAPPARTTAQQPPRRPDFVPGPRGLQPTTTSPSRAELRAGSPSGRDWLMHTRDYAGTRFSPLRQVTAANASRLRVSCSFQVGETAAFQTGPVVHDGTMYFTASLVTMAIDAATCRPKWRHEWRSTMPGAPTGLANRGVAIAEGRVIRATLDGYLVALDAATGRLLWARRVSDALKGELISMPPTIHDDLVYIGTAVSEFAIRGWIAAHRVSDGERVWRFNIVPEPGEPGAETWKQDSKLPIGGGAVWTPLSFDLSRGLLYVPAANPAPDFPVALRGGTNLYTNSLVALNAASGTLAWYDQLVPLDDHDWDLTQVSPQYRAMAKGKMRDLVATSGKDGHLRVIDRETHERIFEVPVTTILNAEAPVTTQGTHACPGVFGGVQWNGSAWFQPGNLLVTPAVDWCATFFVDEEDDIKFVPFTNYLGGRVTLDTLSRGWITASDGSTGAVRWRYASRKPVVAAVTTTAGGVVLAAELTGDFLVLNARTGAVLFRHNTGGQAGGGVVTYQVGATQYVAVASGTTSRYWSDPFPGSPTITVFSLHTP